MPYSKHKRIIFTWIPKTGGTSIARSLAQRGVFERNGKEGLWGVIPAEERLVWKAVNWQHISALSTLNVLGRAEWNDCFSFSVVRNPLDRIVSYFEYSRSAREDPKSVHFGRPPLGSIEEWFEENKPHSQLHYIADEQRKIMVDYVGRFENLDEDFLKICLRIKIQPRKLLRVRASKRRDYRDYFDAGFKKKVLSTYGEEIEVLKYQF